MKNLFEPIRTYLKKVFSDLHNAVVSAIVAAIILSGGGIYLFAQQLWTQLKNIAQSPTPLWATITLVLLLAAYIYSKNQRNAKDFSKESNIKRDPSDTLSEKSISVLQEISNYENILKTRNPDGYCIVDELALSKALKISPQETTYHLEQLTSAYCIEHYPSGKYGGLRSKGRELLHKLCLLSQNVSQSLIEEQKIEVLSETHDKVLELLFQKPSTVGNLCKALNLSREEVNYYLADLCYNKNMVDPPTAYSAVEEWRIDQNGREHVMAKRGKV